MLTTCHTFFFVRANFISRAALPFTSPLINPFQGLGISDVEELLHLETHWKFSPLKQILIAIILIQNFLLQYFVQMEKHNPIRSELGLSLSNIDIILCSFFPCFSYLTSEKTTARQIYFVVSNWGFLLLEYLLSRHLSKMSSLWQSIESLLHRQHYLFVKIKYSIFDIKEQDCLFDKSNSFIQMLPYWTLALQLLNHSTIIRPLKSWYLWWQIPGWGRGWTTIWDPFLWTYWGKVFPGDGRKGNYLEKLFTFVPKLVLSFFKTPL